LQSYLGESPLAGKAEFIDSPHDNTAGYEMLGKNSWPGREGKRMCKNGK